MASWAPGCGGEAESAEGGEEGSGGRGIARCHEYVDIISGCRFYSGYKMKYPFFLHYYHQPDSPLWQTTVITPVTVTYPET